MEDRESPLDLAEPSMISSSYVDIPDTIDQTKLRLGIKENEESIDPLNLEIEDEGDFSMDFFASLVQEGMDMERNSNVGNLSQRSSIREDIHSSISGDSFSVDFGSSSQVEGLYNDDDDFFQTRETSIEDTPLISKKEIYKILHYGKIETVINKKERSKAVDIYKSLGVTPHKFIYKIKMPKIIPIELNSKFLDTENVILKVIDEARIFYGNDISDIRYRFFLEFILKCAVEFHGKSELDRIRAEVVQYRHADDEVGNSDLDNYFSAE